MDDLRYYNINPSGRRAVKKTPDRDPLGIGTRSCFGFRPPRTITTTDMSVEEIDNNLHPSDEKLGLLQASEPAAITRSWTYSSAETTANLTSTQSSQISSPAKTISTAERGGYSSSGGDSSLLSMPTPIDRSHQRRLQMERGGQVHKYDGEHEPAGYRGQEAAFNAPATPSPRAQSNSLLAMPSSQDRSRRRRGGSTNTYHGELDPTGNREQESPPSTPVATMSQGSSKLLAMPTPTDRSHVRRLHFERDRKSNAYEREQEPEAFRGREAVTPVISTSREGETLNVLALPTPTDRSHRKRAQEQRRGRNAAYAREQRPMGYRGRISPDKSPEPIFRTPIASGRLRRDPSGQISTPKDLNESFQIDDSPTKGAGSPYLQFSTDGPALRVFETSPKSFISPNSSMMDTSVESSDQIRWMVKDLVPLSASAEKKIKNRVAEYQPTQGGVQIAPAAPKRKPKPILKAPSRRSDYSVANTRDTSIWSGIVDGKSSSDPINAAITPERSALAVIRGSPSGGEFSVSSASTRSSVTLLDMMNDLVEDSATAASGRSGPVTDVDEMAASAQSHVEQGEYDLALVLFGRILALQRRQYGNVHPLVASAYHNLGIVHSQRGSLLLEGTLQQKHVRQQSLQCFQAAARTARDSLSRNHPNVAVSLVKIGFLLLQARQYEPALVTFEEALRIRLVAFGGNPNQLTANLYNNLGICLLHLQRFDESKLNLNKALGIQRHMLHIERRVCTRDDLRVRLLEVADTLANLGGLGLEWLRQQGHQQEVMWEAESQLAEALELRSTVLGYNHPLALQVKSLHDMVRSTPSLVREQNTPPSNSKLQPSSSARGLARGPPKEATHSSDQDYHFSPPTMARGVPASRVLTLNDSPSRSLNTSRDAPAPKGFSPSPVIELLANRLAADACDENTAVSPRMRKMMDSISISRSGAIPLVPPVSEVVVEDEEDKGRSSHQFPERTKIFVSPHYVPRKSPARKSSNSDESKYSATKMPALVSSSRSESSDRRKSQSPAYDTEESCLLNESGDRVDLLSQFLYHSGDDNEDDVNLSAHEIMIVRPSSTSAMTPDVPGPLVQPLAQTMKGQWKGDNRTTQQQQPTAIGGEQLDESDDGIAPLSRSEKINEGQKVHLSEDMLENPEPHIVVIYAAASRYLKKNRLLEAKHLFLTVLDCQRKAHGELHEDVGSALHNVGLVLLRANEYGEALTYFERAVRVRKGSLGREHPEVAVSQVKVGITLLLMHSFDSALQAFVEALSIRKRALGDLHASNAAIYCNIGCVHVEFNELRDARRAFEAALDIQRNALYHEPDSGPLMFGTATTLCNLGYLYRSREMHQKVAMVLKEALSLQESVLGQAHPTVVTTMDSLADALSMSGGCSQALRHYSEILSRLEYVVDISNRRQAEAAILYKCSRVHRKQNDAEAEVDKLKKALQAVRDTGVKTTAEKKRKEHLERHIIADILRSREELEKMQLEWI